MKLKQLAFGLIAAVSVCSSPASGLMETDYSSMQAGARKQEEIKSASWHEVPGTSTPLEGNFAANDSAYININGITRKGVLVIFDVVNPDAGYGRLEGNCKTNKVRALRIGEFKSRTRVSFVTYGESVGWENASDYQRKLLEVACAESTKQRE